MLKISLCSMQSASQTRGLGLHQEQSLRLSHEKFQDLLRRRQAQGLVSVVPKCHTQFLEGTCINVPLIQKKAHTCMYPHHNLPNSCWQRQMRLTKNRICWRRLVDICIGPFWGERGEVFPLALFLWFSEGSFPLAGKLLGEAPNYKQVWLAAANSAQPWVGLQGTTL